MVRTSVCRGSTILATALNGVTSGGRASRYPCWLTLVGSTCRAGVPAPINKRCESINAMPTLKPIKSTCKPPEDASTFWASWDPFVERNLYARRLPGPYCTDRVAGIRRRIMLDTVQPARRRVSTLRLIVRQRRRLVLRETYEGWHDCQMFDQMVRR